MDLTLDLSRGLTPYEDVGGSVAQRSGEFDEVKNWDTYPLGTGNKREKIEDEANGLT